MFATKDELERLIEGEELCISTGTDSIEREVQKGLVKKGYVVLHLREIRRVLIAEERKRQIKLRSVDGTYRGATYGTRKDVVNALAELYELAPGDFVQGVARGGIKIPLNYHGIIVPTQECALVGLDIRSSPLHPGYDKNIRFGLKNDSGATVVINQVAAIALLYLQPQYSP